jgi:hypothetical protein
MIPRVLRIEDEEAMAIDEELRAGQRTARVQVNVTYRDQFGTRYHGTREVKIALRRETDADIQGGR